MTTLDTTLDRSLVDRVGAQVVGRRREAELVVAALAADRYVVMEGPPGTGKSTLLRAVADQLGVGFEFVEGNAELTPARLIGHFDPARVLNDGYAADGFLDGPLAAALRNGALLYIEELNRVPDETLNVLVSVMSERAMTVPRLGTIQAAAGFGLVAAMNPFDAVGTARISGAIYDRVCRLSVDYQSSDDELGIVKRSSAAAAQVDPTWLAKVVEVVRRTRNHDSIRVGSSVRGAIDLVMIAATLSPIRDLPVTTPALGLDAAMIALSGRIQIRETGSDTAEQIIEQLWRAVFDVASEPSDVEQPAESEGKANAPTGANSHRR